MKERSPHADQTFGVSSLNTVRRLESMSLEENVKARERAKKLIQLVGKESDHYWKALSEEALLKIEQPKHPRVRAKKGQPMNQHQAVVFEKEKLPYGSKWKNFRIEDIDPEYLTKLRDGLFYKDFNEKLDRYLASERFKERQKRK